ncbi:aminodeoxychorismate lyase [Mahella australiensis]|uniref:Aminodeoxychorismate lyase n=1 Tax=Mahella australiensis (strain DSM 15567 / CIP 107919 / 50-1 BON) TaxID=697281 RepID=F4A1W9_MAHA5|nr:aminodeoxychorismate lyase [Mahella australiensis]AEE96085.1 aminodeoxychorismate lyase [Mahella australiensis 50-1 BON]
MKRIFWGSLVLGMGIGIFITALLAIVWFDGQAVDDALSDQQIMEKAKALGMIDPTEGSYKQSITADGKTHAETETGSSSQEGFVVLTVNKGMTVSDVAGILRDTGVISDDDTFIDEVRKADLITKLQPGIFKIKKGSTTDEIIRLLFKK